mmetsp:Transcript_29063/g.74539  ORF Transcript_29063/g.74539 Transcript_29063/m.74539 type:complete len:386 (-) Transcript_29063:1251-2408(-)
MLQRLLQRRQDSHIRQRRARALHERHSAALKRRGVQKAGPQAAPAAQHAAQRPGVVVGIVVAAYLAVVAVGTPVSQDVQRVRVVHERHHRTPQASAVRTGALRTWRALPRECGVAHGVQSRPRGQHGMVPLMHEAQIGAWLQHHHAAHEAVEHAAPQAKRPVVAKGRKPPQNGRHQAVIARKSARHDVTVHDHVAHAALWQAQLGQHVLCGLAALVPLGLPGRGPQLHAARLAEHCGAAKRVDGRDGGAAQHSARGVHQKQSRCQRAAKTVPGERDRGKGAAGEMLFDQRQEAAIQGERSLVDAAVHLDTELRVLKNGGVERDVGDPAPEAIGALDDKVARVADRVVAHKPLAGAAAASLLLDPFGGRGRLHHLCSVAAACRSGL